MASHTNKSQGSASPHSQAREHPGRYAERRVIPTQEILAGAGAFLATERARPRQIDFMSMAQRVAPADCNVLITGETGAGKGWLADWMHHHSRRAGHVFVPVNCGAIPEDLIDSQLFGHAKGSFSGAVSDHIGMIRAADSGTLFLDEVGDLPHSAQIRLLRLLQDREVQPVGHVRPIKVDVRVLAATNMDLWDMCSTRDFREDLLYRLEVISLLIPPLRQRTCEIQDLVGSFNHEFASLYEHEPLQFREEAMHFLMRHPWPGNIRQLRTIVERLHILVPDQEIGTREIHEVLQLDAPIRPHATMNTLRMQELQRILVQTGGSIPEAARAFGVHRSTIYRWLQDHPT